MDSFFFFCMAWVGMNVVVTYEEVTKLVVGYVRFARLPTICILGWYLTTDVGYFFYLGFIPTL